MSRLGRTLVPRRRGGGGGGTTGTGSYAVAWGNGRDGQLGGGWEGGFTPFAEQLCHLRADGTIAPMSNVRQVSTGIEVLLAVTTDSPSDPDRNNVYISGANFNGAVGQGIVPEPYRPLKVPIKLTGGIPLYAPEDWSASPTYWSGAIKKLELPPMGPNIEGRVLAVGGGGSSSTKIILTDGTCVSCGGQARGHTGNGWIGTVRLGSTAGAQLLWQIHVDEEIGRLMPQWAPDYVRYVPPARQGSLYAQFGCTATADRGPASGTTEPPTPIPTPTTFGAAGQGITVWGEVKPATVGERKPITINLAEAPCVTMVLECDVELSFAGWSNNVEYGEAIIYIQQGAGAPAGGWKVYLPGTFTPGAGSMFRPTGSGPFSWPNGENATAAWPRPGVEPGNPYGDQTEPQTTPGAKTILTVSSPDKGTTIWGGSAPKALGSVPIASGGPGKVKAQNGGHISDAFLMEDGSVWYVGEAVPNVEQVTPYAMPVKKLREWTGPERDPAKATANAIAIAGCHKILLVLFPPGALVGGGNVLAIGGSQYGTLGDGTEATHAVAIRPESEEGGVKRPLDNIVAVSAGESHALALDNTGSVFSWGRNAHGEIGIDSPMGKNEAVLRPTKVPVLEALKATDPVVAIGAAGDTETGPIETVVGKQTSMALLRSGKLMVWGGGKEGNNGDLTLADKNHPVYVPGITNATGISFGPLEESALVPTKLRDPTVNTSALHATPVANWLGQYKPGHAYVVGDATQSNATAILHRGGWLDAAGTTPEPSAGSVVEPLNVATGKWANEEAIIVGGVSAKRKLFYVPGDCVFHAGKWWVALKGSSAEPNQNLAPESNPAWWEPLVWYVAKVNNTNVQPGVTANWQNSWEAVGIVIEWSAIGPPAEVREESSWHVAVRRYEAEPLTAAEIAKGWVINNTQEPQIQYVAGAEGGLQAGEANAPKFSTGKRGKAVVAPPPIWPWWPSPSFRLELRVGGSSEAQKWETVGAKPTITVVNAPVSVNARLTGSTLTCTGLTGVGTFSKGNAEKEAAALRAGMEVSDEDERGTIPAGTVLTAPSGTTGWGLSKPIVPVKVKAKVETIAGVPTLVCETEAAAESLRAKQEVSDANSGRAIPAGTTIEKRTGAKWTLNLPAGTTLGTVTTFEEVEVTGWEVLGYTFTIQGAVSGTTLTCATQADAEKLEPGMELGDEAEHNVLPRGTTTLAKTGPTTWSLTPPSGGTIGTSATEKIVVHRVSRVTGEGLVPLEWTDTQGEPSYRISWEHLQEFISKLFKLGVEGWIVPEPEFPGTGLPGTFRYMLQVTRNKVGIGAIPEYLQGEAVKVKIEGQFKGSFQTRLVEAEAASGQMLA